MTTAIEHANRHKDIAEGYMNSIGLLARAVIDLTAALQDLVFATAAYRDSIPRIDKSIEKAQGALNRAGIATLKLKKKDE